MSKPYNTPKYRGRTKVTGSVIGIIISGLLFLAIPLTQIYNDFDKNPEQIETINVAPPPPPPPPEDPPEPPPPEVEEPPPELNTPPPPISLEQLVWRSTRTGGSMAGDFALPTLDLGAATSVAWKSSSWVMWFTSAASHKNRVQISYFREAQSVTESLSEYVVNRTVGRPSIVESPTSLSKATEMFFDTLRTRKQGYRVKVRMRAAIPYG